MDEMELIKQALLKRLPGYTASLHQARPHGIWFAAHDGEESIGIEINGTKVEIGFGCDTIFDLSDPCSICKIVDAIIECLKHHNCVGCKFKGYRMPDKMREHIATSCKGDCDDLCGKMGINYCPLK